MKMCPDGSLSQKKFIEVSRELYGNQAKNLSESIFNIFDEDQSGHIDFVEYMMVKLESRSVRQLVMILFLQAINSSNMHTPESKLNWIFNVFDKVRYYVDNATELYVCVFWMRAATLTARSWT